MHRMEKLLSGLSFTELLRLRNREASLEPARAHTFLLTAAVLGGQDRVGSLGVDPGIRILKCCQKAVQWKPMHVKLLNYTVLNYMYFLST